jgi:hypothetical protein
MRDGTIFLDLLSDTALFHVQVCISSTARTLEESATLYRSLGFHFESEPQPKKKRVRRVVRKK